MNRYANRIDAGKTLAESLASLKEQSQVLLLALPRGGVPVAAEISKILSLPFDVFIVRKLGVPGHEELAFGAVASGGTTVLNQDIVNMMGIDTAAQARVIAHEEAEVKRREKLYRADRPPLDVKGKHVIVVDDGLATGATMQAAVQALRTQNPARITIAVPVAPADHPLFVGADEFVCPRPASLFFSVGGFYDYFPQTTDQEVIALLRNSA